MQMVQGIEYQQESKPAKYSAENCIKAKPTAAKDTLQRLPAVSAIPCPLDKPRERYPSTYCRWRGTSKRSRDQSELRTSQSSRAFAAIFSRKPPPSYRRVRRNKE